MPSATVIDYLDTHQGAFAALLTVALIAVTIYYAIQNRRMAEEMKRAASSRCSRNSLWSFIGSARPR